MSASIVQVHDFSPITKMLRAASLARVASRTTSVRAFGTVQTKTSLVFSEPRATAGTVYGGVHTVTLIPGDGVGQEMAASVKDIFKAVNAPVTWEQFDLSGYTETDAPLLRQAMDSIRKNKVALKGVLYTPVSRLGHASWNIFMRRDLDVYASTSLIQNLPGNWPTRHNNVNIAIIRENTEGEYSGKEHTPVPGVVESLKVVTRAKTERIARYAFDFALKNNRKKVTIIHKANIMKLGDGLFLNTCREVAKGYESFGIKVDDMIVDNASMQLVSKPHQFDVIVCGNLYGNILSNVGSALVGGPGLVPGANIGRDYAVFEPGCRHVGRDIQGHNTANPTALIISSVHLLRHIGLDEQADRISAALTKVIKDGRVLTPDVGGSSSTTDFTQAVIANLAASLPVAAPLRRQRPGSWAFDDSILGPAFAPLPPAVSASAPASAAPGANHHAALSPPLVPKRRRLSLFDFRKRSASVSSSASGASLTPQEARDAQQKMNDVLDAHMLVALKRSALSPFSLAFRNPDDEAQYRAFFLEQNIQNWRFLAVIGIVFMFIFEMVFIRAYSQPNNISSTSDDLLTTIPAGLLPLMLITGASYLFKSHTLAKVLHLLSVFYIWVVGPVLICGRYFISTKLYDAVTAPFFITIMFLAVFFFKVRFVYTLVATITSVAFWFGVSAAAFSVEVTSAAAIRAVVTDATPDIVRQALGNAEVRNTLIFVWSSVSVVIASIALLAMAYVNERNHRLQYLSDIQFITANAKLHKQLRGLQSSYESGIADLDSPLEKAIMGVKALLCSHINAEQIRLLHIILNCLTASNLMAPDLYQQVKRGDVQVDDEQEKWLFHEIAARKTLHTTSSSSTMSTDMARAAAGHPGARHRRGSRHASAVTAAATGEVAIDMGFAHLASHSDSSALVKHAVTRSPLDGAANTGAAAAADAAAGSVAIDMDGGADSFEMRPMGRKASAASRAQAGADLNADHDADASSGIDGSFSETSGSSARGVVAKHSDGIVVLRKSSTYSRRKSYNINIKELMTPQIQNIFLQLDDYNFPVFDLAAESNNRPLFFLAHQLVVESGLLARMQLPADKFLRFMAAVEDGYDANLSYHNSIHASDVLHSIRHLSRLDRIHGVFSDVEVLAMYIAASIHDYEHPGVSNNFLIQTGDRLAMLYNDKSVLENHHCSAAFNVMVRPENHFLEGLDRKTFKQMRSIIVEMVLATDLTQHFSLLTAFKKKVVTAGTFDPAGSQEDRLTLMQMLMKCADVSNPTKSWPLYKEWVSRITEEFFNQGDRERALGLPFSPYCNRDAPNANNPTSSQQGFIEFIVNPMFEALECWTPVGVVRDGLNHSRERFCAPLIAANSAAGVAVTSPTTAAAPAPSSSVLAPSANASLVAAAPASGALSAAVASAAAAPATAAAASSTGSSLAVPASVVDPGASFDSSRSQPAGSGASLPSLPAAAMTPPQPSRKTSGTIKPTRRGTFASGFRAGLSLFTGSSSASSSSPAPVQPNAVAPQPASHDTSSASLVGAVGRSNMTTPLTPLTSLHHDDAPFQAAIDAQQADPQRPHASAEQMRHVSLSTAASTTATATAAAAAVATGGSLSTKTPPSGHSPQSPQALNSGPLSASILQHSPTSSGEFELPDRYAGPLSAPISRIGSRDPLA
ncbi:isocitrate dehydrogenase (NAD(+)) idh1 [Polyrhizophydium stewartii]|uniref:Phosphodiesterase n=1 Tax=Polyrhizophydium stewartii TaxID=2732419 RepID=A0ABR4MVQ6_9FUNG